MSRILFPAKLWQLNNIAHEQTIICRQLFAGHVVGFRPMKRTKKLHRMIIIVHCYYYWGCLMMMIIYSKAADNKAYAITQNNACTLCFQHLGITWLAQWRNSMLLWIHVVEFIGKIQFHTFSLKAKTSQIYSKVSDKIKKLANTWIILNNSSDVMMTSFIALVRTHPNLVFPWH